MILFQWKLKWEVKGALKRAIFQGAKTFIIHKTIFQAECLRLRAKDAQLLNQSLHFKK